MSAINSCLNAEHFRQSLIELADALEKLVEVDSAPCMRNLGLLGRVVLKYAKKARISAGCEE